MRHLKLIQGGGENSSKSKAKLVLLLQCQPCEGIGLMWNPEPGALPETCEACSGRGVVEFERPTKKRKAA